MHILSINELSHQEQIDFHNFMFHRDLPCAECFNVGSTTSNNYCMECIFRPNSPTVFFNNKWINTTQ